MEQWVAMLTEQQIANHPLQNGDVHWRSVMWKEVFWSGKQIILFKFGQSVHEIIGENVRLLIKEVVCSIEHLQDLRTNEIYIKVFNLTVRPFRSISFVKLCLLVSIYLFSQILN